VLVKNGDVTNSPTSTVGSTQRRHPSIAAIVEPHIASSAVEAMSSRPTATTGRPVTAIPAASTQTLSGEVAALASRNGVRPQRPYSTSVRA
jgi:hypothetical protein